MNLFHQLFKTTTKKEFASQLHQKLQKLLPRQDEENQLKLACLAGLLARIAYTDLRITPSEQGKMAEILRQWSSLGEDEVKAVAKLACEEVVALCGLENTRYCHPLADRLSVHERFRLLKTLFAVAAADGSVEHVESEEIRYIAQGLKLEHRHYVSARATVLDKLKALRN